MNHASKDLDLLVHFVSDLLSRVLMICGSLMAVANGLVPSLGAMIYGNLTDELVIRKSWNCTLSESVTTITLENLVTLEMIEPRMKGTNVTQTRSIEVTVNKTGIRVVILGMNGKQLNERIFENATAVELNGTALNGTELVGIYVKGTHVEMVQLKNESIEEKQSEMNKGNSSDNRPNRDDDVGDVKRENNEMKTMDKDGGESEKRWLQLKRSAEGLSKRLTERNVNEDFMKNDFFESSRKRRQIPIHLGLKILIGSESDNKNYPGNITNSLSQGNTEFHKTSVTSEEKNKRSTTAMLKEHSGIKRIQLIESKENLNASNGIVVGKAQSITALIPPTPKPIILPSTNNVTYILRNITENCRSYENNVEENMRKYALYYVYAALATLVFAYGQMVFWNIASERGVRNLSENLTDSVLDKDPGFYDTKIHEGVLNLEGVTDPRDAINQKDLDALSGGLGGEIAYMIQSVSNVMSGFLVSFIENWKITMVMMTAAPVLGIVQGIADKVEKFVMKQKEELMNRAKGIAKKSLGSIKTVTAYAGEKLEKARYSGKLEATANLNKLKSLVLAIQKGLTTVLAFGFLGLGFWYSSTLLPGGSVTPGALMTIFMAIISGVMQTAGTGEQVEDISDARSALTSLFGISESGDDDPFEQAVRQLDTVFGKLEVFHVYFHYPSRPEYQILKSINFTVDEGQTVALLGDKGCGKSALIKLLQRIYDPQTGKVRLDGQDIRFLDRRWLRRQIGIVHKNPEFFNTSIADNIANGKGESTLKEIVRAAKDAGAHEFIMALPNGYATVLNEDGSPLTSYQKHLLALARALIRNPRILLWEEDLSIMDSYALNVLTQYLDKARQGRTAVISTSHVSVARIADVIIFLHNGEIIEQGSPEELMLSGGAFRYLATLQYFESQSIHQERLLKTAPVSTVVPPVKDGIETLESNVYDTKEKTKNQMKGFISQVRQMIQDKLNEGQAAYKMIRMQLKDLPLLLAGALGAAITGMVAPGLSLLFGEIQKFMDDPLRVAHEGPFWASMFVVLGVVVGFGGTIEKFMLSYATEKLRTRLQKMAFDTAVTKDSVPQNLGPTDGPSSFPGTGGQIPGIPRPSGTGFLAVPGLSKEQLPSTGGVPSQSLPGIPTGIPSSQGLPVITGIPTGDLSFQGIPGISGVHTGSQSSQDVPAISGVPTGNLSSQGIPGVSGIPSPQGIAGVSGIPSPQGISGVSGVPTGVPSSEGLPGISTGIPATSQALPGVSGLPTGSPSSQGLVSSSVGVSVPGSIEAGVMTMEPGSALGSVGAMTPGSVGGGVEVITPDSVGGGVGALAAGGAMAPSSLSAPQQGLVPGPSITPAETQYDENAIMLPCDSAEEMGVQQLQGMVLPPNIPNADLLVLPDPQKQADQLIEQVERDVEAALQNSIGKYLGTTVQETISSVSTLGMALYNGWKMTLVVLAGLPIIGMANRIQQNEADASVEPEGVEALMKTSFKKMETISALGMENKFAKKYKEAIFEKYKHALKKILASGFAFALGQAMVFFIYAGALRFGCFLITVGDMTPIQVLGVLMTVLFGSYATSSTRAPTHASENTDESLNRLFDDETTEEKDQMGDKLDEVEGSLDFKHVEVPDPLHKGAPLLSQLDMKISPGQILAIVPLDNGKLNPFELLVGRFYDPARGTLFLDGADIRGLDLTWLRSQHAVVSHRCFLPHYSIADNIAYGNDNGACAIRRREIEDAAYSAYAHEFITALSKGYETVPDEEAIVLTESQKLRIVIARAIIRGPPIIVLDELEDEDQAVTDATQILCRNRTCLIFTRRRQTVESANQIVLIYRGHILEQGTPDELWNLRRLYYLLTNLEASDET